MLNRDDRNQTFQQIVAGHWRVLLLEKIILSGVLIYRAGQCRAKAGLVRTAVRIMHRVGIGQNLRIVTVVVLQDNVEGDIRFAGRSILRILMGPPSAQSNRLRV